MPNQDITYIGRILEKTTSKKMPIHQKAFAIVTCDNLINPNLSSLVGKKAQIKPLLSIYMVNLNKIVYLHLYNY
jgi:hypothetical protein